MCEHDGQDLNAQECLDRILFGMSQVVEVRLVCFCCHAFCFSKKRVGGKKQSQTYGEFDGILAHWLATVGAMLNDFADKFPGELLLGDATSHAEVCCMLSDVLILLLLKAFTS